MALTIVWDHGRDKRFGLYCPREEGGPNIYTLLAVVIDDLLKRIFALSFFLHY